MKRYGESILASSDIRIVQRKTIKLLTIRDQGMDQFKIQPILTHIKRQVHAPSNHSRENHISNQIRLWVQIRKPLRAR